MNKELSANANLSHYRIVAKIGAGGMGEVYLAEDTELERSVALKVLLAEVAEDEDRVRRFVQEAKAASALNHPNILTVYEIGNFENLRFIATELIKGETLRETLESEPLTLQATLDVAVQVAAALNAAHEAGIVHRDIKPENIMLRDDGLVKILDFGIAKLTADLGFGIWDLGLQTENPKSEAATVIKGTIPGMIIGTANYMSPEQARGKAVDARSDIFSFGIVLYEMLSGKKAFAGETAMDALGAILHKEPLPLNQLLPEIPPEIERIINKTLKKDAGERYQTAKDLLVDLKEFREELSFQSKLERSSPPNKQAEAATLIIKAETTANAETQNSIAVLPFENMSADAENEYFCDGLAEEFLNALAKIDDLKVAARTSAFSFKGKNVEVSEIGNALNVKTVLEGSVRKSGNKLRITVQLVNAADGYHLWSERYDREMQDIFDVQDEITLAVVDALKLKLFGEEKAVVLRRYTDNAEAYELYLKGFFYYNRHSREDWLKGLGCFERAVEIEPEYAPAFAGIGICYTMLYIFGVLAPDEIAPRWKEVTNRALATDENLAEAHFSAASLNFHYEWNWTETEREFRRAIELNPNSAVARMEFGMFLSSRGRFDEAIGEGKRAVEIDPLSLQGNLLLGWMYMFADRMDETLAQARRLIELEPNFYGAYWQIGYVHLAEGKYAEAIEPLEKAASLGNDPIVLSILGFAYGAAGRRDEAAVILQRLLETGERQYIAAFNIARVYSGLGMADKTSEWLEKAIEYREGELIVLDAISKIGKGKLWGDAFHTDSRILDLLRRNGLTTDGITHDKTTNEPSEAQTAMLSPVKTDEDSVSRSEKNKSSAKATSDSAAVPPDVRKVSDFPTGDDSPSGYAANIEAQPQEISESNLPERHSLSAHQAAQPQRESESLTEAKPHQGGTPNIKRLFIIGLIIFLLTAIGLGGYWFFSNRSTKQIESIAVMPFVNESGNADVEYLSDGMTETLISSLSQLPNLNVKARSSVFRYKGKETNAQTIGKELNVQAILNGRVVQRGQDLILYVELVEAATENSLWKQTYNKTMTNLVALQTDVARDVADKLKVKLSGADEQKLAKNYTENTEAYKLYLQGRFYRNKSTGENNRKAIELFNQAIAIDPNYALAYAGIADAYPLLSFAQPQPVMSKAREAALKALSLDNNLAEAHVALGRVLLDYDYDFAAAEREYKIAIELDPNYAGTHTRYGLLLTRLGRHEEAFAKHRQALELEPLSLLNNRDYGESLIYARRYDEAVAQLKKTLELDANFLAAHVSLAFVYLMKGNYAESIEERAKVRELQGNPQGAEQIRESFAKGGWEEFLRDETGDRRLVSSAYTVATFHAALGEKDKAFAELNKSYENREYFMTLLKVDPRLDPLRDDPRFQELLRRVGLPH